MDIKRIWQQRRINQRLLQFFQRHLFVLYYVFLAEDITARAAHSKAR